MTLKLRPGGLDDIDEILKIENSTNKMPWTKKQFISSLEVGHYLIIVEEKMLTIGFATYSPIFPESHLLNFAIDPMHQGKGLGKKLLDQVILQNRALGVKVISLEVRVSNLKAINLYKKFGFTKDAIRPDYYSGSPKEDALLMSLKI
tara:strand:+ start:14573 stop:15013 length:441 start_codon:yes stop_codon:yes gene_type:complete